VRELAALDEAQLGALGMKPFHARRLRRWVAQLEETAAESATERAHQGGPHPLARDAVEAMDVGELKRAL